MHLILHIGLPVLENSVSHGSGSSMVLVFLVLQWLFSCLERSSFNSSCLWLFSLVFFFLSYIFWFDF